MFSLHILHAYKTADNIMENQWHQKVGLWCACSLQDLTPDLPAFFCQVFIHYDCLFGLDGFTDKALVTHRESGDVDPLSMLDHVTRGDYTGFRIVGSNRNIELRKYLMQPLADHFIDGLDIQFGGEALLHTVKDGKLSVTLLVFFVQTFNLVGKASVFRYVVTGM
jgi:hypothetical protein